MKRFLSFTLSLIMVFGIFSVAVSAVNEPFAAGSCSENINWSVDAENGTLTISGTGDMPDFENASDAPWALVPFSKLVISDGVTSVGKNAFAGAKITGAEFGKDVTVIKSQAFLSCESLVEALLPESVTLIETRAFYGCLSLNTVTFGEVLASVEDFAFYGCAVKYVIVPASVTSIGNYSFGYYCDNSLDDEFAKITGFTLRGKENSAINTYAADNGFSFMLLDDYSDCFTYEVIGDKAIITGFTDSLIPYIEIPDEINGYSIFGIEDFAFENSRVKTVVISDNISYISPSAFLKADFLENINVSDGNHLYASKDGVLYNKGLTSLVCFPCSKSGSGELSGNLTAIEENAFYNCKINGITIPDSVTSIGKNAFAFSTVKKVVLPKSLTALGNGAFLGCSLLSEINIPASLTAIPENAFYGCKLLTSVIIPKTVTAIGELAFYGIPDMKSVSVYDTVSYIGEHAFGYYLENDIEFSKTSDFKIYGAKNSAAEKYANDNGFDFYNTKVATPELLSLDADNNCITLTWESVYFSDGYNILRKTNDGEFTLIASINNNEVTMFCDLDAINGNTYTYTVEAFRGDYVSDYDENGLSLEFYSLETPIMVSAAFVSGAINVKWKTVDNAEGYILYRCSDNTGWSELAELSSSKSSYSDKNPISGETNYYAVRAFSGEYISAYDTDTASAFYLANPVLKSAANAVGGIKITWAKTKGADGYIIGRKSGSGDWTKIAETKDVSSYTDKTVKTGVKYTYTVVPKCGEIKGFYDAKGVSATYLPTPKPVSAVNSKKGVTLSWKTVSGAAAYVVYRKINGGSWARIAVVKGQKSSSYLDTTAVSGKDYIYTVKAYKSSVYSSYYGSGVETIFLSSPKLTSAKSARAGITVKYGKVSGANGYIIYRKTTGGWSKLATVKGNSVVSYLDKTAKKGTTYTYTVRAYYGSYKSSYYSGVSCKDKY